MYSSWEGAELAILTRSPLATKKMLLTTLTDESSGLPEWIVVETLSSVAKQFNAGGNLLVFYVFLVAGVCAFDFKLPFIEAVEYTSL